MAVKLECELCGGKLVGKPGGIFECDSCGMEYSTEWAKAKIQEIKGTVKVEGTVEVTGKVQVEGGTVKVEGTSSKGSLLKRAKLEYADGKNIKARELLNEVLNIDPECAEAYLYLASISLYAEERTLKSIEQGYADISSTRVCDNRDLQKAFRFATGELAETFERWKAAREINFKADEENRRQLRNTLPEQRKKQRMLDNRIACLAYKVAGVKSDGTVLAVEDVSGTKWPYYVTHWFGVESIGAGSNCIAGVKFDGSVVAVCEKDFSWLSSVREWKDIASVAGGILHMAGLKRDGTVVAVGDNSHGQCNVSEWRDIVEICCAERCTIGVKADGTVVATGHFPKEILSWKNVVGISCGNNHAAGLLADGTVVACGNNDDRQCNVSTWRNVVSVQCGRYETAALTADGKVLTAGRGWTYETLNWQNIVALRCNNFGAVGLKSDGTLIVTKEMWQQDIVKTWKLFENIAALEEDTARTRESYEQESRRIAAELADLSQEKAAKETELASLKGLFTGKRRKELEEAIVRLNVRIKELKER